MCLFPIDDTTRQAHRRWRIQRTWGRIPSTQWTLSEVCEFKHDLPMLIFNNLNPSSGAAAPAPTANGPLLESSPMTETQWIKLNKMVAWSPASVWLVFAFYLFAFVFGYWVSLFPLAQHSGCLIASVCPFLFSSASVCFNCVWILGFIVPFSPTEMVAWYPVSVCLFCIPSACFNYVSILGSIATFTWTEMVACSPVSVFVFSIASVCLNCLWALGVVIPLSLLFA